MKWKLRAFLMIITTLAVLMMLPFKVLAADVNKDGYNDHDFNAIQSFLNQSSLMTGTTNGQQLNPSYVAADPATWTGVAWDGAAEQQIVSIGADYSWQYKSFAGALDLSGCTALEYVNCAGFNQLSSLHVSGASALNTLYCFNSQLSSLDLHTNTALRILNCSDNPLSALDIHDNPGLTQLYCQNTQLSSLTVSTAPNLFYLDCSKNSLKLLDTSANPFLSYLFCNTNLLPSLDISANPAIVYVNTSDNPLEEIKATITGKSILLKANPGGYVELFGGIDESMLNATAVPKLGASFLAWTSSGTQVSSSATYSLLGQGNADLVANFTHTVTYDKNGGETGPNNITVPSGTVIGTKPDDPARTGYTFDGWYKEKEGKNAWDFANDVVNGNTTLYAGWTPIPHTVSFDSQGGTEVASATVNYDALITKPADPMLAHFAFGGWYKEKECTNAWDFTVEPVKSDTTLYAKWTAVISGLPETASMSKGGRISWEALPSGGTWSWDSKYFSASFNGTVPTFTARKAGSSAITYTVGGVTQNAAVTINESDLPITGQNDSMLYVWGSLALICCTCAIRLLWRKKRRSHDDRK